MDDKTIILLCLSVIVFSIISVDNYLDSSIGIKSLVVQVQKVSGEKNLKLKQLRGKIFYIYYQAEIR